jgi:two-component system, cell cycle sensor histidine kinase and response regulator CckA
MSELLGTRFQIYLPRIEEAIAVVKVPVIVPQPLHGAETILVIEDDNAIRRITREFLKIKGYTLVEARGTTEALQVVENRGGQIDLGLTDVLMLGMKERELVERLVQLRPDLRSSICRSTRRTPRSISECSAREPSS